MNNTGAAVDPENEAYEMPPEVNLLCCLLGMLVREGHRRRLHAQVT